MAEKSNSGVGFFGAVPSREEVERAISELQRLMNGHSTSQLELDVRRGGLMYPDDQSNEQRTSAHLKFHKAFNAMRKEPSFQNTVVALSSSKAVWDAILSNKAVQDLQSTVLAAQEERPSSCAEEPDMLSLIWRWILDFAKLKVLELLDRFDLLVTEMFQLSPGGRPPTLELTNLLEEKVRSSFLLTVAIILVVVVTRIPI